MEQHAKDDSDKAIFILVCTNDGKEAALQFKEKHSLDKVVHVVAVTAPEEYGVKYLPHHVVINETGIVVMNYNKPTKDFMSHLKN